MASNTVADSATTWRIGFNDLANLDLGADISTCANDSIGTGENYFSYQWNTGETTPYITPTLAGTYTLTGSNIHGCSVSDSVGVTYAASIDFYLADDTVICDNEPIIIDGNFTSCVWNNGVVNQYFLTDTSGTFWVTCTDSLGCSKTDSINIIIQGTPVADFDILLVDFSTIITQNSSENYTTLDWTSTYPGSVSTNGESYIINGLEPCTNVDITLSINNGCGQSDIITQFEYIPGCAINDLSQLNAQLYPNPTHNKFVLEFEESTKGSITIVDVNGKTLLTQEVEQKITEVNSTALAKGIYFLKFTDENGKQYSQKIVKM